MQLGTQTNALGGPSFLDIVQHTLSPQDSFLDRCRRSAF